MRNLEFRPLLPFDGFLIGHKTDAVHGTGCTAVLCPTGAVGGVDVRGGGPGTRETALLDPACKVDVVHGVALSGGSAFGLGTADGVMRWLVERGHGYDTGSALVPIVPAAIVYDLAIGPRQGNDKPFPQAEDGYAACLNAVADTVAEGSVGAGTGCTVGKYLGMGQSCKGGIGAVALQVGELRVGAIVAVNALGSIQRGSTLIAGARDPKTQTFVDFMDVIALHRGQAPARQGNTTIGAVLTNADVSKAEINKIAQMAHAGLCRAVQPSHTQHDGDTLFALATKRVEADHGMVGAMASRCVEEAIVRAVRKSRSGFGVPAASDV